MTQYTNINVPTKDGVKIKRGFVYHATLPNGEKHKCFIQEDDNNSLNSFLLDYRSGFIIFKMYDVLLSYSINKYAMSQNIKRIAADEKLADIVNMVGMEKLNSELKKHPTLNGS